MKGIPHGTIALALLMAAACSADDPDAPLTHDGGRPDSQVDSADRPDSGSGIDAAVVDVATGGIGGGGAGGSGGAGRDGESATDGPDAGTIADSAGDVTADAGSNGSADGGPCDPPACFAGVIRCTAMGACVSQRLAGRTVTCYANGVATEWIGTMHYFVSGPGCGYTADPWEGGFKYSNGGTIVFSQTHATYTCPGQPPVAIELRACPGLRYPMYGDQSCTILPVPMVGEPLLRCPPRDGGV
jgi:hypothetical protein